MGWMRAIRSSVQVGAAGVALVLAGAGPAQAALVFGVSPNQATNEVLQNSPLIVNFTATMSMASTAPDAKMYLLNNTLMTTGIAMMQGGDAGDQLGAGTLVAGGTCFGFIGGQVNSRLIIGPGASCTFRESFPTSDLRLPDPDNLPGLWTVTQTIKAQGLDANNNMTGQVTQTFTFNGTVLDVLAPNPEPATWALMLIGLGGVGASLRLRRRSGVKAGAATSA